uniref:LysR substrate-binding domain-containing protein n=1 Tax=Nocardioides sp. REDSEA-S30_B4 TaxID=1811552 RepID=UPI000A875F9C
ARLRVVASLTIAEQLAPAWIARFRREQPGHQVRLEVANSEQVLERVLSGEVPLGFVESPSVPQEVSVAAVGLDRLVVVVAPEHPWARRTSPLTPTELAAAELVLREEGSGTRRTLARALARADAPLGEGHLELASTAAVRAAALQGDLPAVLSELGVADQLAAGALVEVPVDGLDLSRTLRAVWLPSRRPSGDAARLLRIARAAAGA